MIRLLYDHQIFGLQQFGGVSRMFVELMKRLSLEPGVAIDWFRGLHQDRYDAAPFRPRLSRYFSLGRVGSFPRASIISPLNRLAFGGFVRTAPRCYDIYHPSYYDLALSHLARFRKLVITIYDLIPERFLRGIDRFAKLLEDRQALIARADMVLVISENTRRDLIEHYGVDPPRIRVTYPASDMAVIQPRPIPEYLGRPYFLFVGNRFKYKNFEVLLRTFASSPALRREFAVICVGGSSGFLASEAEYMAAHNIEANFVHVEADDATLRGLYGHAVALVYTSRYEGFGLPPLEAMQCDCPVVCGRHSSLTEVVGSAASFFDVDSEDDLAQRMLAVAGDAQLRARMIESGRRQAQSFSWERTARQTLAAYQATADAQVQSAVA